ncbi:L,D-transpeptidase [Aquibium oceanicum]|uniref:L,D-TPase catalytic domain-containing protein n=1 Tax=Aquibium oceanicum TaxID=1670800 RepID=A0A1L3SQ85_9HYPH|nr:L,D-transpeptidase [Aquibium oceanicum]APH71495.1 hypothetical protein BSQ44_09015 [Aquibium oceanicum]
MTAKPSTQPLMSRRFLLSAGALAASQVALSACTSIGQRTPPIVSSVRPEPEYASDFAYPQIYGARVDAGYEIPAVPYREIDARLLRQYVADPTGEAPGTIVVDTSQHYLYLVQPDGRALRYGVGLGRDGFAWSGRAVIQWKKAWPTWTPPEEMIAREPELAKYSADNGGMQPGLDNPLGARALYIFQDGQDTLYRVHGSPEWWSIGKSVSSGCVRMINQDVIDLYSRVADGSPILVTSGIGTV